MNANRKLAKPSGHILVVDDNRLNRSKIIHILQNQQHTTCEAANGREALNAIQQTQFDLILLDIVMPVMDGFAVLEEMRQHNLMVDLPVIVISAQDELENAVRCIEMGAEDYLIKPFDPVLLLARINAALEKKRLRDQEHASWQQLQIERQRLHEYTLELQARNEELDAFAHTAAHDLKNPLGTIVGYTELVKRYYADKMDERGLTYLDRALQASLRMSKMIDGLLLLASIRNQEVKPVPLQMVEIIESVEHRLDFLLRQSQAEIVQPPSWPTAVGYAPWVEEIWANYFSNGIKYGGVPPRMELGATPQPDNMIRFWIRDNGQGITPEDQERLFTPFERLNKVQAEGHGLGLSVVRRIAKKLGGVVGVESVAGEGSVFYFTLPAAPS